MKKLLFLLLIFTPFFSWAGDTIYVNANYAGSLKNGESWSTPYTTIYDAYTAAKEGDELWFAKGNYDHISDINGPISLSKGVHFYGGFSGTEKRLDQRNIEVNQVVFNSYYQSDKTLLFLIENGSEPSGNLLFDNITFESQVIFGDLTKAIELVFNGCKFYDRADINLNGDANVSKSLKIYDCFIQDVSSDFYFTNFSSIELNKTRFEKISNLTVSFSYDAPMADLILQDVVFDSLNNLLFSGVQDGLFRNVEVTKSNSHVYIYGNSDTYSQLVLDQFYSHNNTNGVYMTSYENLQILNSRFIENEGNSIKVYGVDQSKVSVVNLEVGSCNVAGSSILEFTGNEFLELNNIKLVDNNCLGGPAINTQSNTSINVDRMTLENNFTEGTRLLIFSNYKSIEFLNSNVHNNVASSGSFSLLTFNGSSESFRFKGNTFTANDVWSDLLDIQLGGGVLDFEESIFKDNRSGRSVVNLSNNSDGAFKAVDFINNTSNVYLVTISPIPYGEISFENVKIHENTTTRELLNNSNELYLDNVIIEDNTSLELIKSTIINLENSQIINNIPIDGYPLIYASYEFVCVNSEINNNRTVDAPFIQAGYFTFDQTSVSGNQLSLTSSGDRGVLYGGTISLNNSTVKNNTIINSTGDDNLLINFLNLTSPSITNTVIANNYSPNNHDYANFFTFGGNAEIINSTFYGNVSPKGDLIESNGSSMPMNIHNSIIWSNRTENDFGSSMNLTITHSNTEQLMSGVGNMSENPEFVNPSQSDFRLACTSPLLNQGANAYAPQGVDAYGVNRIMGDVVDMGAFEFNGDPRVANAIASPAFSISNLTPCRTEGLDFINETPNLNGFTYVWDYGDTSAFATQINGAHYYKHSEDYKVKLTAVNSCGRTFSSEKTVTVRNAEIPEIIGGRTICPNDTLELTTNATCGDFNWIVDGGSILSGQGTNTITVQFGDGANGNGKIDLQVQNCDANICELPVDIVVPIIPASLKLVGEDVVCEGQEVVYHTEVSRDLPDGLFTWGIDGGSIESTSEGYNLDSVLVKWNANSPQRLSLVLRKEILESCPVSADFSPSVRSVFEVSELGTVCGLDTSVLSTDLAGTFTWSVDGVTNVIDQQNSKVEWGNTEGIYVVKAIPTNMNTFCNLEDSVVVQLLASPEISSINGETLINDFDSYIYEAVSTSNEGSFNWTVTGGSIQYRQGNKVSVVWNQGAPYSLSVEQTLPNTCKSVKSTIQPQLDNVFPIVGNSNFCVLQDETFTVDNQGISGLTYAWYVNDQLMSNSSVLTYSFSNAGYHDLLLEIDNAGRLYRSKKRVKAEALTSILTVSGDRVISPQGGGTLDYDIENPDNLDLDINIVGGTQDAFDGNKLTITWGTVGPFAIEIVGTKTGETCSTEQISLTINKAPVLSNTITKESGVFCLNENSVFSAELDELAENIQWTLAAGGTIVSSSNDEEVEIQWSSTPGNYQLILNYDRFGAQQLSYDIVVGALPQPSILGDLVCQGDNENISTASTWLTYAWYLEEDPGTILSNDQSFSIGQGGTYVVEVTDVNGCVGRNSKFIQDIPLPKVKIQNELKLCEGSGDIDVELETFEGNGYTYEWYKNGTVIPMDSFILPQTVSTVSPKTDVYQVKAEVLGCSAISAPYNLTVRTTQQCSNGTGSTCPEKVSFDVSGCQPFTVVNTSSQTSGFIWKFGDGQTSSTINPGVVNYSDAGIYTISLENGCAKAYKTIEVPAQAEFSLPEIICQNEEITITDVSYNLKDYPISKRTWTFGNGQTQTALDGSEVKQTYGSEGPVTVMLEVEATNGNDDLCKTQFTKEINVLPEPVLDFDIAAASCDDNLYVTTNRSTNALAAYSWDLDDGITSTAFAPQTRYNITGSKTITLHAEDLNQCTNTLSKSLEVTPMVVVQEISKGGSTKFCDGGTVKLTSPNSDLAYKWLRDGLDLSVSTQEYDVTSSGQYQVEYSDQGCLVVTEPVKVEVFAPQNTIVKTGGSCAGDELTFSLASATQGYTAEWYHDGVLVNKGETYFIPSLSLADEGNYEVIFIENGTACRFSSQPYTLVLQSAPAQPSISGLNKLCYDTDVTLNAATTNPAYTYRWLEGANVLATGDTYSGIGLKQSKVIQLEATNSFGCFSSSQAFVLTVDEPKTLTINGPNSACENSCQSITSSLGSDEYDYEWSKDGKVISSKNRIDFAAITLSDAGNYTLKVTSNSNHTISGCVFNSNTINVDIISGPSVPVISGETEFCEGEQTTLYTDNDPGIVWSTSDTDSSISVFKGGTYILTKKDLNTSCEAKAAVEVTVHPVPQAGFTGTGEYEWCGSEELYFEGLSYYPTFQWKKEGTAIGKPNEPLYARRSGDYSVLLTSDQGCQAESDVITIKSLLCACVVVTTEDNLNVGSLRDAINCANTKSGVDFISFAIPGNGPHVLKIDSALPVIEEGVIIDGFSQSGEQVFDVVVEPGQYDEICFEFSSLTDGGEISGLSINGFKRAMVFGSNTDEYIITNNRLVQNQQGIVLGNASSNFAITENKFQAGKVAIKSTESEFATISNNEFTEWSTNALSISGDYNHIDSNYFYSNSGNSDININRGLSNKIRDNHFGYDIKQTVFNSSGAALTASSTDSIELSGNYFTGHVSDVIDLKRSSNAIILNNEFGRTSFGLDHSNMAGALALDSSVVVSENYFTSHQAPVISVDRQAYFAENIFENNASTGIAVTGDSVKIEENLFKSPDLASKAIKLVGSANGNKTPAVFQSYERTTDGMKLSGVSQYPNDTIELYYSSDEKDQALVYLGEVVSSNANAWEFVINEGSYFDPNSRNHYVNTATKNLRTSELSEPFVVGCFECTCLVENTNDAGVGSLRAAVDSAHAGTCQRISFAIPLGSRIVLDSVLRKITVPVSIEGLPGNNPIQVIGKGKGTGFNFLSATSSINHLAVKNWGTGIELNANNVKVTSIEIDSTIAPIRINSDGNNVASNCINCNHDFYSGIGIEIFGVSNQVGGVKQSNVIKNTTVSSIQVNSGTENTLTYNTYFNTIKGISHLANGNNNYASPSGLMGDLDPTNQLATISGIASIGDTVQIYLSDFTGKPATELVSTFVADQGNFTVTIPSHFIDFTGNQYFVLTSTGSNGNTSEFSSLIKLGDNTIECIVRNTKNEGPESFRAAVTCANEATAASSIRFDLPSNQEHKVVLLDSGVTFTNAYPVELNAGNIDFVLSSSAKLPYGIQVKGAALSIERLEVEKFQVGVRAVGVTDLDLIGNTFVNNDTSTVFDQVTKSVFRQNTVDSAALALYAKDTELRIENNIIGEGKGVVSKGIELQACSNCNITFNTFGASINELSLLINGAHGTNVSNNTFESLASKYKVVRVNNSKDLFFISNELTGGKNGVHFHKSDSITASLNKIDSISVSGFELTGSEYIKLSSNTGVGNHDNSKPIVLNYNTVDESNLGIPAPEFNYATYKNRKLILRGKAYPESEIEIFETDTIKGIDLIRYVQTVRSNDIGEFEVAINVSDPNKINSKSYRASATSVFFAELNGKPKEVYTSEVSEAFHPDLKICFVDNESDENIEGSLRNNIIKANKGECHLMLFDVPNVSEVVITPGTDYPVITTGKLIMDATYQDGYAGTPIVNIVGGNVEQAFVFDTDTGAVSSHGFRIKDFNAGLKINSTNYFEQSLSEISGFDSLAVLFDSTDVCEEILFEENLFISDQSDYILKINTSNVRVEYSTIIGGKVSSVMLLSDTINLLSDTLSNPKGGSSYAIHSYRTDSCVVEGNVIKDFIGAYYSEQDTSLLVLSNDFGEEESFYNNSLYIDQSFQSKFIGNIMAYSDTTVYIDSSYAVSVEGSMIDTCNHVGIYVQKGDSIRVRSNFLTAREKGILIDSSKHAVLFANRMSGHALFGIELSTGSDSSLLERNVVGSAFSGGFGFSEGIGVQVYSSYNLIGGSDTARNEVFNNLKGGIVVDSGLYNKITHNSIYHNSLKPHSPDELAIVHLQSGNDYKEKPTIESYDELVEGERFKIVGLAEPNDSVHVYRADGYYQDAKYFAGAGLADGSGYWEVIVDTTTFKQEVGKRTLTFVATATDADNNTSELSDMAYVGTCYILSTKDTMDNMRPYPNSFRQAVKCANSLPTRDSIISYLDGFEGYDIYIENEMLSLSTKHGVYFDGLSAFPQTEVIPGVIPEPKKIEVYPGYFTESSDTTTFWRLMDSTQDVSINNLVVHNFDTAVHVMSDSIVELSHMKFYGINDRAILLDSGVSKVLVDSLSILDGQDAQLVHVNDSASQVVLTRLETEDCKNPILVERSDNVEISNSTFKYPELAVQVYNSDTVNLFACVFENEVKTKELVVFDSCQTLNVEKNELTSIADTGFVIKASRSVNFKNNEFTDDAEVGVLMESCVHGIVEQNEFKGSVNYGVKFIDSDSLAGVDNEFKDYVNIDAFYLERSNNISFSQNTIDSSFTNRLINTNRDSAEIVSNHNKERPIIDAHIIQTDGEECVPMVDSAGHLGLYLQGTAKPYDNIELFLSDSIQHTMFEFVDGTSADANGKWEVLVPKQYYGRSKWRIYSFVVTATDQNRNTARESDVYRFSGLTNDVVVKYVNDDGRDSTLRTAIEAANCSDLHTIVYFEIDAPDDKRIVLEDTLPEIRTWRGITIDALGTQADYHKRIGIKDKDSLITISGLNTPTDAVFRVDTTSDWIEFRNIRFEESKRVIRLEANGNVMKSLDIVYDDADRADTAIVMPNSSYNLVDQSLIKGYKLGLSLSDTAAENRFSDNVFEDVTIGIDIAKLSEKNNVRGNRIDADSIGVYVSDSPEANYILTNRFGDVNGHSVAPGVVLRNAHRQYVLDNHFTSGTSGPDSTMSFIYVANNSSYNTITNNRFGSDDNSEVQASSNMVGITLGSANDTEKHYNNVVTGNDFSALQQDAIVVNHGNTGIVSGNFIGIDSAYIQKGENEEAFFLASGVEANGISMNDSYLMTVSGNHIINFLGYGIDVKRSEQIAIDKNIILSEVSDLKGIHLNLGTLDSSNLGVIAPSIDTNDVLSKSRITVSGMSAYPNSRVQLFQSYSSDPNVAKDHALRFIREVQTDPSGNWEAIVPTENFGFGGYNQFVAQVKINGNSSEFSDMYTVTSLLCRLKENNIDLVKDEYRPCQGSNFDIDAQLNGLTYTWTTVDNVVDTAKTRIAPFPVDADVTLLLEDQFGCSHEEEFTVRYKDLPEEPLFLVTSETYVSDTIKIVDISQRNVQEYDWSVSPGLAVLPPDPGIEGIVGPDGITYPDGPYVEVIAPDSGNYTITLRSKLDGCFVSLDKEIQVAYKSLSHEDPYAIDFGVNDLLVFPSPVAKGDNVNILIKARSEDPLAFSIYDTQGRIVFEEFLYGSQVYSLAVPTGNLSSNVYIARVERGSHIMTYKFVIQGNTEED